MLYASAFLALVVLLRAWIKNVGIRFDLVVNSLALVLIPVGAVIDLSKVSQPGQERLDVHFLGYSIPWQALRPCDTRPDPMAEGGIWIGGGQRWEADPNPDVHVFPGYRSHLVEICKEEGGAPTGIRARLADPGMLITGPSEAPRLVPANGLHTQRVLMTSLKHPVSPLLENDCLRLGSGALIELADVANKLTHLWNAEKQASRVSLRRRLLELAARKPRPDGEDIFCVDPSQQNLRCSDSDFSSSAAAFIWVQKKYQFWREWNGLPPGDDWERCVPGGAKGKRGEVSLEALSLPQQGFLGVHEWDRLPGIRLRMISRRLVGSAGDTDVPSSVGALYPAGFRLGPNRELRFASADNRLYVLVDEPSIRLRDLLHSSTSSGRKGEFDLRFGRGPADSGLQLADLAAAIDGLSPKPYFDSWRATVKVDDGRQFLVEVPGHASQMRKFNTPFRLPPPLVGEGYSGAEPLVLVRRVFAARSVWAVCVMAPLLLILGMHLVVRSERILSPEWLIVSSVFAILVLRFLLSYRIYVDEPNSSEAVKQWLLAGCYTFALPPLILLLGRLLGSTVQSTDNRVLQENRGAWGLWLTSALLSCIVWVSGSIASSFDDVIARLFVIAKDLAIHLVVVLVASGLACLAYRSVQRILLPIGGDELDDVDPLSPIRRTSMAPVASSRVWLRITILSGLLLLLSRLLLMALGWRESVAESLKVDVLYLPIVGGLLAGLCGASGVAAKTRLLGLVLFWSLAFPATGYLVSDMGLLWVGSLALVLALPFSLQDMRPMASAACALIIFLLVFLSPKIVPQGVVRALRYMDTAELNSVNSDVEIDDYLFSDRPRDHYRLMDAVNPSFVESIPSQLAREVSIERHRVKYQATEGAWSEGSEGRRGGAWSGAGFLHAGPLTGGSAFQAAAKSDYVYQIFVRAEYGTIGLLILALLYVGPLVLTQCQALRNGGITLLGLWALAIGYGSALFMLGGVNHVFPFSGKWPLLLALGSRSDICLGTSLLVVACLGVRRPE